MSSPWEELSSLEDMYGAAFAAAYRRLIHQQTIESIRVTRFDYAEGAVSLCDVDPESWPYNPQGGGSTNVECTMANGAVLVSCRHHSGADVDICSWPQIVGPEGKVPAQHSLIVEGRPSLRLEVEGLDGAPVLDPSPLVGKRLTAYHTASNCDVIEVEDDHFITFHCYGDWDWNSYFSATVGRWTDRAALSARVISANWG